MSQPPELVPCYACGSSQQADQEACEHCDAPFTRDCKCGAQVSIYESHCPVCFRARRRKPRRRGVIKKVALVVLALGAVGTFWYLWDDGPHEEEAWKVKEQALLHYKRGTYDEALKLFEELTERTPRDASVWYNYAASQSKLEGFDPVLYEPALARALELDPRLPEALSLMALAKHRNGDRAGAMEYAERAIETGGAEPRTRVLLAELEMSEPVPDLGRALDALEGARAAGYDSPVLRLQLAELRIRLVPGASATEFSKEALAALQDANAALEKIDPAEFGHLRHAVAKARLAMVSGREDAVALASSALARVPALSATDTHIPQSLRAQYHILKGKIYLQQQGVTGQDFVEQFHVALETHPYFETAAEIAGHLKSRGYEHTAIDLLTKASSLAETGGIHGVLAGLYLGRGQLDEAAAAISSAGMMGGAAVPELQFLLIEGDVRLAQRRIEDARAKYVEASLRQPRLLEPKLRLALLSLSVADRDGARREALSRQIQVLRKLEEEYSQDPRLWRTLGQLYIGLGKSRDALSAIGVALDLAPGDASSWRSMGDAYLLSEENDALVKAAEAYERAVIARPFEISLVAAAARTRLELNDTAQALVHCTKYLDRAQGQAEEIVRLRLECHKRSQAWAAAAADMMILLEQETGSDRGALVLEIVQTLFKAGLRREARSFATKQIQDNEGIDPDLQRRIEFLIGQYDKGERESIRMVQERGPSLLAAQIDLGAGDREVAADKLRTLTDTTDHGYAALRLLATALLDATEVPIPALDEAERLGEGLDSSAPSGLQDLIRGAVLLGRGLHAEALERLRGAADVRSRDPLARYYLGRALFETGDRRAALVELRAASLLPGAPQTMNTIVASCLLRASLEDESPRRAEMLVTESLRLDPRSARAHLQLSALLHARGEFERAAVVAENGLGLATLSSELSVALRYRALTARAATGELSRALIHLDDLPLVDRDDARSLSVRGFAYLSVERQREAINCFRDARLVDPSEPLALLGTVRVALDDDDIDTVLDRIEEWQAQYPLRLHPVNATARLLVERKELDAAVEIVEASHDKVPGDLQTASNLVWLLGRRGRTEDAIRRAERFARDAAPDVRGEAKLLLGRTRLRLAGDAEGALELARSVRLTHADDDGLVRHARTLEAEGLLAQRRIEEAGRIADEVAEHWPAGAQYFTADRDLLGRVWFVRGVVAISKGLHADAADLLDECVEVAPTDAAALNNLAWALVQTGGSAVKAMEFARRATAIRPSEPAFWDTHGLCALRARDTQKAEASWTKALEFYATGSGTDPRARARTALALADLLIETGRKTDGRKLLAEIDEYAKGSPESRRAGEILRGGE